MSYDYIIVCYDMIIKCKMSENLLGKSETVAFTLGRVLLMPVNFNNFSELVTNR